MTVVAAEAPFASLDKESLGGIFFVIGDDEYLKEEAARRLARLHLDPATRDFNLDQLRGQGIDPETLASVCQTPPMLAEWRVVIVRDAQALASNPRLRAVIEQLTDRRIPGLALILVTSTGERPKSKFQKRLERQATTLVFDALPAADLPGWLMARAADAGVELEPAAAQAMAIASGPGLGILAQELDKLIDFVGDRRRIGTDDVAKLIGELPTQNRWAWFDLVGDARFDEARAGLAVLLDGSETGVGLLLGLGTQMLRLGIVIAGGERTLQSALPPHQKWLASRIKRQARNWNRGRVDAALDDMLRADRLMKSASLDDHHVMDELLLRMQHGRDAA